MKTLTSVSEMQTLAAEFRRKGRTVGFVPTMGSLHEGHLSLMRKARPECEVLVVSIFVNRMQFGPAEDFAAYPRDMERDVALCSDVGVDIIFAPANNEMYADDFSTVVEETMLSGGLCGACRPGHFRGVTTVVAKLFNIVQPDFAVFGQKDAQQAMVIKRMVRDLNMPVRIELAPIVRESDGLAMSSRNTYLSGEERLQALCLSLALRRADVMVAGGERDTAELKTAMEGIVRTQPAATIDYIEVVDADSLAPVLAVSGPTLIALAVRIGDTRLIDNTLVYPRGGAS